MKRRTFSLNFFLIDSHKGGFTLLEVMIAIAVIGGLLVTLIYTLNYHLTIAERHEFITVASMLAKDKLTEIEKLPEDRSGNFPAPYTEYRYRTEVSGSKYDGMSEVSVIVSRGKENVMLSELIQAAKQ